MNEFLVSIERKAYRMACISTGKPEDALDLVQDAMVRFVEKYADKPREQWTPLFYRILHNRITDHHRRRALSGRWLVWFSAGPGDEVESSPVQEYPDPSEPGAEHRLKVDGAMVQLEKALHELPLRQRQVFLLRVWEEFNVADTALAMNCSQGTVKTHYSRAIERLRARLGDHWP
jgi:RNA polymerase sigma-70 factor, ECF subfamily